MDKFINYIKTGKGNGLIFLLASAVLVTIFFIFIVKQLYTDVKPRILLAAEDLLPITIEGGKVVSPADAYKTLEFKLDESDKGSFLIVLDTKNESTEISADKTGLFIFKDMLYLVTPNEIKKVSYADGVFDMNRFTDMLNQIVGMFSLILSVVSVGVLFLVFLIKSVIVAGVGKLICKTEKKEDVIYFSVLMRGSSVFVAVVEFLFLTVGFISGYMLSGMVRLILEALLLLVFFKKNPDLQ